MFFCQVFGNNIPNVKINVLNRGVHNTYELAGGPNKAGCPPPGWAASGKLTGWMGIGQVICPGASSLQAKCQNTKQCQLLIQMSQTIYVCKL